MAMPWAGEDAGWASARAAARTDKTAVSKQSWRTAVRTLRRSGGGAVFDSADLTPKFTTTGLDIEGEDPQISLLALIFLSADVLKAGTSRRAARSVTYPPYLAPRQPPNKQASAPRVGTGVKVQKGFSTMNFRVLSAQAMPRGRVFAALTASAFLAAAAVSAQAQTPAPAPGAPAPPPALGPQARPSSSAIPTNSGAIPGRLMTVSSAP
jgi:hypothetical protein